MRRLATLLAALAVAAVVAGCGATASPPAPPRPAAQQFLDRYVDGDGRVVRRDQGGDTVSEGQAYAMLLAAASGDERRFDRVWRWTRAHLQRGDGLLAWHWRDGRVVDRQPAADADLDAARALQTAARRFGRPALRRAAQRMAAAILRRETAGGRLVAGPWARRERVLNPSYWSPVAARALARLGDARQWERLRRRDIAAARTLVDGGRRLPPDWARAGPAAAAGAASAGAGSAAAGSARAASAPAASVRATGPPATPPRVGGPRTASTPSACPSASPSPATRPPGASPRRSGHGCAAGTRRSFPARLDGRGAPGATRTAVALVGAAAAAHAAGDTAAHDRLLVQAEALDREHPTYFGAAWVALGRTLLARRCT
ncbi:MAG: glycosyl hydrolase family 8 [Solirubrobacterales bacterium]